MAKASLKWGRQIQISKPTALRLAFILLPMFLVLIIASSPTTAAQQATGPEPDAPVLELRGIWTPSPPYEVPEPRSAQGVGGLDIDILSAVADRAGIQVKLKPRPWTARRADLLSGQADITTGAFQPADGDSDFYYSLPYRYARISLFLRNGEDTRYDLTDTARLIASDPSFRIGIITDRTFQDPAINHALIQAGREGRLVATTSDEDSLRELLDGRIDGFLTDRLGAVTAILAADLKDRAYEKVLPGASGVRFMFSKATITPETVNRFNAAISQLEENGALGKLGHAKIFSAVLSYVFSTPLFRSFEITGIIAAALSGVLIAYHERFNLAGALFLSALPAVGGGVLRDLILNRHPIFILASPLPLCLVALTVVGGLFIIRIGERVRRRGWNLPQIIKLTTLIDISDAVGLGAFTVTGVAVAVIMGAEPLWLWGPICAMLTSAGGGILRDVLRQAGKPGVLHKEFYIEVPLIWGALLSLYLLTRPILLVPENVVAAILITGMGATFTRLLALAIGFRGLAFNSEESSI